MNTRHRRFLLGWILVAIATINALGWVLLRWSYENSLRGAQLTVDYDDTRALADAYQIPHAKMLAELKARGVSSVSAYYQTLSNLRGNGRVAVTPREEAERLYPNLKWKSINPAYRNLVTATRENQSLLDQVFPRLVSQGQKSLPPVRVQFTGADAGTTGILLPASGQIQSDAAIGFDPAQIEFIQKAGLRVTARVGNSLNFTEARMEQMLDDIAATGARVVIFSEDEVVGYDSLIKQTAEAMKKRGLIFGNIEFTKQRGWQDFAKQTNGLLVRVHSVGGDEAAKAKVELLVDRYARAVKERDIRVAYIRLVRQFKGKIDEDDPSKNRTPLQQNLDFIADISKELKAQPVPAFLRPGMETTTAQAFGDYPMSYLQSRFGLGPGAAKLLRYIGAFLSGLGAVGGTLLLLNLFFDLSRRNRTLLLILGVLMTGLLAASQGMGAKLLALQIGIIFSVIGVLWGGLPELWDASRQRGKFGDSGEESGAGRAFWSGCVILLKTSAITLIGPILIIALLNHWKFFSGTDKYLLPKATQLFPLLLVGLAFAGEVFPHKVIAEGAEAARTRARNRFMNVLNQPFTIRVAGTLLLLFILGTVWIARTGNDSGMEISSFELKMRATLEQVFITRPRTKEIFVGMPAMIFAVYFALRRRWMLGLAAAVVATIGQADMLNTFCHIHTPLFYSLLRSIHGLWLGALIGGIALAVYVLFERRIMGRFNSVRFAPRPNEESTAGTKPNGTVTTAEAPAVEPPSSEIGTVFVPEKKTR